MRSTVQVRDVLFNSEGRKGRTEVIFEQRSGGGDLVIH